MGRGGDWKMRREGESDGEVGRLGEFLFLCSPFFLLPDIRYIRYIRYRIRCRTPFFLLTNSRARHPRVKWSLQVGNWEQRVQAKQEECPDLPQRC